MVAPFPTALQRTSDERWVTLDVVARDQDRALARILEVPAHAAVVRLGRGQAYDHLLRDLLSTPPPDAGGGVHLAWPVDLLHDLDAQAIGYAALRPPSPKTFALADFVDPTRRAVIAPLATRRHLLRVARNVSTAMAALHHSGHGRIRGRQLRLDDRARIVVVRADELVARAPRAQQVDDQRRLGWLVVRLLGGRPWASDGELAALIRRAGEATAPAAPAQDWFFALRAAERALPVLPAVALDPEPGEETLSTRVVMGTDLATALRQDTPAAPRPASPRRPARPPVPTSSSAPPRRRRRAVHIDGRHTAAAAVPRRRIPSDAPAAARPTFAVAAGLSLGGIASVAPFLVFALVATLMVLRAAIDVGRRKATRGPLQTIAITLTRLVPFATGGVAVASFVLLDLLLLLGLCMALAERLFGYGPGFTLQWIVLLPEVPGLVRAFAFAVAASAGLVLGGQTYDRIRRSAGGGHLIASPALALALATGTLVADATIVWWPIPLVA